MTTCITNYLASKILRAVVHKNNFSLEDVWVALHTSDPTATGDPSTELVGGSYERLQARSSKWSTPSNSTVAYQAYLKFMNLPAATVTHVAMWTGQGGGNMVIFGPLPSSITVDDGGTIIIGINDLAITLSS